MISAAMRRFASAAPNRVGFIGLGNMGLPMASNLAKAGFNVKGFDLSQQVLDSCKEHGITPASSLAEVSKQVDFIVTSLPKTEHVDQVLKAEDGVFANADKGTLIADTSTISPMASKEFSDLAKKHDVVFVDSPMSGGIMGAQAGTLTFMVGTDSTDEYEKAKIVLAGMGKKFFHCGGPGTGEIAKICNNMIIGIQMNASAEGLSLGEKLGIDPKVLSEILAVSTASCWVTNTANPHPDAVEGTPASRDYNGGFQVALMRKDMTLALDVASKVDASVEFGQKGHDYFLAIEKKGYGHKDFGYAYQYISKGKKL